MTRRTLLLAMFAPPPVQVIAHRGEHIECPENTLPAIAKAIEVGTDWVELDIRTTQDGKFVLMHDATVDATTNGTGAVASLTFDALRRLDAGVHRSRYSGTRIPSFDEALALIRQSRAGLYLDAKAITAPAIIDRLKAHRMLDRCVVYGRMPLLRALRDLGHAALCMPEAVDARTLTAILSELPLRFTACDGRDFTDDVIALARKAGARIFVDRLGPVDNPDAWLDAVHRGATGIQTDHPAELFGFLRKARLRNAA